MNLEEVFKHCNIILEPSNKNADAGFVIMEPEDNPPMRIKCNLRNNSLIRKNIVQMKYPKTMLTLKLLVV